jgi:ankyrin repeat protein
MADRERLIIVSVVLSANSMLAGCAYREPEIHKAVRHRQLDRTRTILKESPKQVGARGYQGSTPLHQAIGPFRIEIFKFLIASGAGVNAKDRGGWTPLHKAVKWGHKENVELLLANEANVNIRNSEGKTPLDIAFLYNRRQLARLLRNAGATKEL